MNDSDKPPVQASAIVQDGVIKQIADPRIRDALAALPVLPKMHCQIDAAAAGLTTIIVSSYGRDLPKAEHTGSRIALKELVAVGKLANRLKGQLDSLHKESYGVIHAELAAPRLHLDAVTATVSEFEISNPLERLKADLARVHLAAKKGCFVLARDKIPAPRGRRPKHEAARITSAAANCFESLTGKQIARSIDRDFHFPQGEFHHFLAGLFELSGIAINVDEQIRNLLADRRKRREKHI